MIRPGIEAHDVVTPTQAARDLGKPAATVRSWILRYHIEPVGVIKGRNVYDYRELAAVEARMRAAIRAEAA